MSAISLHGPFRRSPGLWIIHTPSPKAMLNIFRFLHIRNEKLLNDPARLQQISERIPAGRWGQPRDFAGPVVFLASNASQYVCGELLVVDGVSVSCSVSFFVFRFSFHTHTRILHVSRDGWAGECGSATLEIPLPVLYKHFDLEVRGPDRSDRGGQAKA